MSDELIAAAPKRRRGRPAVIPVGERFGELTILGPAPAPPSSDAKRGAYVFVRCDCGFEKRMRFSQLINRGVKTCGNRRHFECEIETNLTGKRFGLLTVVSTIPDAKNTKVVVRCDCGTERTAIPSQLRRGQLKTCNGPAHKLELLKPHSKRGRLDKRGTYAVEAIGLNMIKIGSANDFRARLLTLQASSPVELKLIASSPMNVEIKLHALLAAHRLHGEWFAMSADVMAAIRSELQPDSLSVIADVGQQGKTRRCHRCGRRGHYAKTCPDLWQQTR